MPGHVVLADELRKDVSRIRRHTRQRLRFHRREQHPVFALNEGIFAVLHRELGDAVAEILKIGEELSRGEISIREIVTFTEQEGITEEKIEEYHQYTLDTIAELGYGRSPYW